MAVVQWVGHWPVNRDVPCSIPSKSDLKCSCAMTVCHIDTCWYKKKPSNNKVPDRVSQGSETRNNVRFLCDLAAYISVWDKLIHYCSRLPVGPEHHINVFLWPQDEHNHISTITSAILQLLNMAALANLPAKRIFVDGSAQGEFSLLCVSPPY